MKMNEMKISSLVPKSVLFGIFKYLLVFIYEFYLLLDPQVLQHSLDGHALLGDLHVHWEHLKQSYT